MDRVVPDWVCKPPSNQATLHRGELLEVSRSGFYQWRASRHRGLTPSQARRADLDAKVAAAHAASDGVYGAPRILADLRADDERMSSVWMTWTGKGRLRLDGVSADC
jgi:hypothetical protein